MSIDTQCVGTNKERRRLLRGLSGKVAGYLAKSQGGGSETKDFGKS